MQKGHLPLGVHCYAPVARDRANRCRIIAPAGVEVQQTGEYVTVSGLPKALGSSRIRLSVWVRWVCTDVYSQRK